MNLKKTSCRISQDIIFKSRIPKWNLAHQTAIFNLSPNFYSFLSSLPGPKNFLYLCILIECTYKKCWKIYIVNWSELKSERIQWLKTMIILFICLFSPWWCWVMIKNWKKIITATTTWTIFNNIVKNSWKIEFKKRREIV